MNYSHTFLLCVCSFCPRFAACYLLRTCILVFNSVLRIKPEGWRDLPCITALTHRRRLHRSIQAGEFGLGVIPEEGADCPRPCQEPRLEAALTVNREPGKDGLAQSRGRAQEQGNGQLQGRLCPFSDTRIPGPLLCFFFIQGPEASNFWFFPFLVKWSQRHHQ